MRDDIASILADWPYEPGRILARILEAEGMSPKLQVRVELGILQMELDGRPDGTRPQGHPSLFDWHLERRAQYEQESDSSSGYVIASDDCRALREEAVQYYHRYVACFAIARYQEVIRDCTRNLALFDLVRSCAADEADRRLLEQFRPQVIMMRARAEAERAIAQQQPRGALEAIDRGLDEIRSVASQDRDPQDIEQMGEIQLLRGMRDALVPKLPASQRVELEERLQSALDAENYELAAILRDELRLLRD